MTDTWGIERAVKDAKKVAAEHPLCDSCLGRMYAGRLGLSSNRALGRRMHDMMGGVPDMCYICRGLADGLEGIHRTILEAAQEYEFGSILVGVILKPSIIERDDRVRSRHHLAGAEGIKTDVSGQLAARLCRRTGAGADRSTPELIVTADLRTGDIIMRARDVVVAGRYTKSARGLPQRQHACRDCGGRGCASCKMHGISGFESIEGKISEFLYGVFAARRVRITWVGGEEKASLVGGGGRPFYARVTDPGRRHARLPVGADLGGVALLQMRRVPAVPAGTPGFVSKVRMSVQTDGPPPHLERIAGLAGSPVAIYEGPRRTEKMIHAAGFERTGPASFAVILEIDGGIPVRGLVDGETVFPNLTDLLGTRCVCEEIDFEDVIVQ